MVRRYLRNVAVSLLLLGLALPAPALAAETTTVAPAANSSATVPATATSPSSAVPQINFDPSTWPPGYIYADVPPTHWAASAILTLKNAGVLSANQTSFRPSDSITRAEFFKMILAARQIDVGQTCEGLFTDVACSAWYAPVAEMAYRMAIAEGLGDGTFGPAKPVTREELAVIMIRALGRRWDASQLGWTEINRRLTAFKDDDTIAWWARPSVGYALGEKLATGYADGTFQPKKLTTRAEAAAVISRILLSREGLQTVEVDGRKVTYSSAMDMRATMYTSGEPGVGTITYTGLTVRIGTVAVDPTVIPLGRLLYVEGYGYVVAADIGSAIKGKSVDLFTYSLDEAIQFGVRPRRVFILP